ncbi:uncharacterized protein LOC110247366 [Exaiptasia diaphana]|uniref:Single-stranded DNA-binding protein n=1 Tax=Exaiptasia diaphana TaxID=2652724 RepID=A0A913XTF2_EXADI|nr:uncharacterized protein LOC110247366 [Exaiptasia diaphana]
MTGTLNKTMILGYLGGDPEIRMTESGREIARLTVATNEHYTDAQGQRQKNTEWHRLVVFADGLISKVIKPYLKKGSKLLVEGRNATRKYTDKNGVERYSTDVIVRGITLLDRQAGSQN